MLTYNIFIDYNQPMKKELYWKGLTPQEKQELAAFSKVHYTYLSGIFAGKTQASPTLVAKIVEYSDGLLNKCEVNSELYPSDVFCKD